MHTDEPLFSVTKNDFEFETFRSGGKGGQHQNKTNSGVRLRHKPSGVVAESREERSQLENKKIAFKKLTQDPKFLKWIKVESARRTGLQALVEAEVERQMQPQNLLVEGKDASGKWIKLENTKID